MENLQYVQKKMTMSFNRKYTSDITHSHFCLLQTYILFTNILSSIQNIVAHAQQSFSHRQYKTVITHVYANHSVAPQYKTSF